MLSLQVQFNAREEVLILAMQDTVKDEVHIIQNCPFAKSPLLSHLTRTNFLHVSYLLITYRSIDPRGNCCHSFCFCGHCLCIWSYNVFLLLRLPATGEELPATNGKIWTCNKSSLSKFLLRNFIGQNRNP